MIILNNDEKNTILNLKEFSMPIEISKKRKFIKPVNEFNLFGEITGMRIAELIGLKCAKYDFARIGDVKYILSDDIGEGTTFRLAQDIFNIELNSIIEIQAEIKKYFPNHEKDLMKDIIKIYIMDILTINFDRNSKNWGIKINNSKPEVWIFDNEYIFLNDGFPVIYFNKFTSDLRHEGDINSFLMNISEDVENFLNYEENFYQKLFYEILKILTPTVIKQISMEVVKEICEPHSEELFIKEYHKVYEYFTNMICKKQYNYC